MKINANIKYYFVKIIRFINDPINSAFYKGMLIGSLATICGLLLNRFFN